MCLITSFSHLAEAKNSPGNSQELTDLKIATGAYEDGLYKIAAGYLEGFLKKYPGSKYELQVSMLLGSCLRKTGENTKALKVYQSILTKHKIRNPATLIQIHYAIYEIYLKKGKKKKAITHLRFIVDYSFKKRVKATVAYQSFLELSDHLEKSNNTQEALSVLDKLLKMKPPAPWNNEALLKKVVLLSKQKHFKEMISVLEPVILKMKRLNGNNKTFYLYWAIANLKTKRYCRAQEVYDKLIDLYSDTPTLSPVLTGFMVSSFKCFADQLVREQTFKALEKRFRNRPSVLFQIYYLEGYLNFEEGKYEKSRVIWVQAIDRFPDHPKIPDILLKLDKVFHGLNDLKAWESLLTRINKGKKYLQETKEVASLLTGDLYFSQKKYETALPFYFNIINKKKYRKYCLQKIVLCYYYLGKFKEAKTNLGILLLENPQISDKPSMLFLQADLLLRSNKTEKALKLLKKLVHLKNTGMSEAGAIWKIKAELALGKLYFIRKDFNNAKRYLLEVFRHVSPSTMEDNRNAAFFLGLIATQEQNYELSETYFQIASLSKDPKVRVEALFRRGLTEKMLKSYYESMKTFEKIIKEYPDQQEWADLSRLELAKLYLYLHNNDKAIPLLKALLAHSKDDDIKKRAAILLNGLKKKQKGLK